MAPFGSFKWTGASGQQIGFAGDYPDTAYDSFTADEVHGQNYNPNTPNMYEHPGGIGDVPVIIQDDYELEAGDGTHGWILDDLAYPEYCAEPATRGHDTELGPARSKRIDFAHEYDRYQLSQPNGYGVDFYGQTIEKNEIHAWNSSSTKAPNTGAFPAQAHEDTGNWPEPFDVYTVAPDLAVVRPTEKIPMRRPAEDDHPVYRMLAVPGQNIKPSGSVYNPTFASNPVLRNIKPTPAISRNPVLPWADQEFTSPDGSDSYVDVGEGMGFQ